MAVVLAWLVWVWAYVRLVPVRYYVFAGLLLVAFFAGCSCARGDEPRPCPVNGQNCTCGCRGGGQCNCALTHVAVERLSRLDPQALAYRDLCEFAERNPHMTVAVYVKADAPPNEGSYIMGCRYDAGWPDITEPTRIFARFVGGRFVELGREPLNRTARPVYYQPPQRSGGNCPGGS